MAIAKSQLMKKLYTSQLAMTVIYGVPFGLLTYFAGQAYTGREKLIHVISGLIFGVLMSVTQKKRARKNLQLAEDTKVAKNKTFDTYLRQTIVPASKAETKALIDYMGKLEYRQEAVNKQYYPKKYSKVLSYGIILLFFVFTLTIKSLRLLAIVYPIVMAVGLYSEYRNYLQRRRIAAMRNKLDTRSK